MGCHTWIYKKFDACTTTQKDDFIKGCKEIIKGYNKSYSEYYKEEKGVAEFYMKHAKKRNDLKDYHIWEEYGSDENIEKRYKEIEEKYGKFFGDITSENIKEFCKIEGTSSKFKIVSDILYIKIAFDDPFRVYEYPEETFTNCQELLDWLKKRPGNKFGYYGSERFISGYTPELEKEIKDYFTKEGEDNLYVEFG